MGVLRVIDLTGQQRDDYSPLLPRAAFDVDAAVEKVRPICEGVERDGEAALRRYSEQFDRVVPASFRVPAERLADALESLDPTLREALTEAVRRRREVCQTCEVEHADSQRARFGASSVRTRLVPVGRVGLYVPGGVAPLASSVLMNVVPAQVAGVESIAVASPPQAEFDGYPHPTILALCALLGVDEVYAVGGAQAIAMFAHGVEGVCPRVDLVTGPGNIYVVAAKRLLRGKVGIDSEAGPTEIAILADDTARPEFVAADLLSQAEHDPMAGSVLVTPSRELADQVQAELSRQLEQTTNRLRAAAALEGQQSAIVVVDDLDQGVDVVNDYGAEHLEIHTCDAPDVAERIRNAGAIFVGEYSPVSLGDYAAGSTHVLPTGGAARFSSGLSTRSFLKAVHVIEYDRAGLLDIADHVENFALAENLPAHAAAVHVRRNQ